MKNKGLPTRSRGYILLEAILAIAVFAMVVFSVVPMISFLLRRSARSAYETRAAALLQEGMEATYNIHVSNWDAYPIDGTYHPGKSVNNRWILFQGEQNNLETLFTRSITIKRPCRNNGNGELLQNQDAVCTGIRDPNSRIVTTTITWEEEGKQNSIEAKLLLVNL